MDEGIQPDDDVIHTDSTIALTFLLAVLVALVVLSLFGTQVAGSTDDQYQWKIVRDIDLDDMDIYPEFAVSSHEGENVAIFDGHLIVINTTSQTKVLEWTPTPVIDPTCMAWSHDDGMIAIAQGTHIKVVSTTTKRLIEDIIVGDYVEYLEFKGDGLHLGASSDSHVFVFDTAGWDLEKQLTIENRAITDFTWSPVRDQIFVFTSFGIYGYNSTDWTPLDDFREDSVGHSGCWVDDNTFVYPTEYNSVLEFDTVNDTDRLIFRETFSLDYAHTLYDAEKDDIIFFEFIFPKVVDRETGETLQYLMHRFPNKQDFLDACIPSSGLELYLLWTDDANGYHLTVLEKEAVVRPKQGEDNPNLAFAMLKEYRFRYDLPSILNDYEITEFQMDLGNTTGATWEKDGSTVVSNDHINCSFTLVRTIPDSYLLMGIWFNWTFPTNESLPITLSVTTSDDIRFEWTYPDALTVVTALEFQGDPIVVGSIQGELGNNSWVKANETIEWTLPRVVYSGYPEAPSPPSSEVMLHLQRVTFIEWSGPPTNNDTTTVTLKAPDVPLGSYRYLLVGKLVEAMEGFDTYQLELLVDGRPPSFLGYLPEQGVWQATSSVVAAVWVSDGEGSGLDETSLQISWRSVEDGPWSEWSDVNRTDMGDGSTFAWLELVLQEGRANEIRWKCSDNVSNSNETGPIEVLVDLQHVTFHGFMPDRWINTTDASCTVNISDIGGSGVSGPSIQVRWSTNGISRYGEWMSLGLTGTDELWNVERAIALGAGTDNYVQWRAEDVAGTGLTDSRHYRIWIDTTPPLLGSFSPIIILQAHEFDVSIEISDSGGSGLDIADVEWRIDGQNWQGVDVLSDGNASAFMIVAMDGHHNVTFRAWDGARNPAVSSVFVVTVDTSPPEFARVNPPSGSYVIGTSCDVIVDVVDDFAGVNESTLVYSVRRGTGAEWGPWLQVPSVIGSPENVTGAVQLDLVPSHDNWVRFRVFDLVGNGPAGSEAIHLPVDLPPIVMISSPNVDETYFDDVRVHFDSSESSDSEGSITVEWYLDGELMKETSLEFHKRLPSGNHTISLVVTDEAGQSNDSEVTIMVRTADVEAWSNTWFLLTIILIAVIASALLMYHRRGLTQG